MKGCRNRHPPIAHAYQTSNQEGDEQSVGEEREFRRRFGWILRGGSNLAFYAAPLMLAASGMGGRCAGRREVMKAGLWGLAAPMFSALVLSVIIGVATGRSSLYRPSLEPTIYMALFSGVAASGAGGRVLIAAITTFGAIRFGVRSLWDVSGLSWRRRWLSMAAAVVIVTPLTVYLREDLAETISGFAVACLVVAGAVITARFVAGPRGCEPQRRVEWLAVVSLVCGLGARWLMAPDYAVGLESWWLMPCYAAAFGVYLGGRMVLRMGERQ